MRDNATPDFISAKPADQEALNNTHPRNSDNPFDQETLRQVSREIEKHFPSMLDDSELVLMEVSPHRLHAYWHVTPWDLQDASTQADTKAVELVLRFHDLTLAPWSDEPPPHFDIDIASTEGSRYVEVWEDAKTYMAELGLRAPDGSLIDLARSNTVDLPKAGYSTSLAAQVLTLTPLAEQLYQEPEAQSAGDREQWLEDTDKPWDLTLMSRASHLAPEFPNPLGILPLRHGAAEDETLAGASAKALSDELVPDLGGDAEFPLWTPDESDPLAFFTHYPAMLAMLEKQDIKPPISIRPNSNIQVRNQIVRQGSEESQADNPALTTQSSFTLNQPQGDLEFELIIRGRTQPGGDFIFYGRPIPVAADGSFSVTQHLPDEAAPLVAQLLSASTRKN